MPSTSIVHVWQIAKTCMNNQKFSFLNFSLLFFFLLLRNITGFVE